MGRGCKYNPQRPSNRTTLQISTTGPSRRDREEPKMVLLRYLDAGESSRAVD